MRASDRSAHPPLHISTPAWIVCSWPPVLWQADSAPDLRFAHLGTRVIAPGSADAAVSGRRCGAAPVFDNAAGVAWDWVEIQRGVVVMADPLGLITNLTLLDAQGEPIPSRLAAIHLNELVHNLPWQDEVQRALARADH